MPTRVEPKVIQQGPHFVDQTTGARVHLRGCTVSVAGCIGNTMYEMAEILGCNFVSVRFTLNDAENQRPTGGDPSLGTYTTRNYDATFVDKAREMADYFQGQGMLFENRTGHTASAGIDYFNTGESAWWNWAVDDADWADTSDLDVGAPAEAPFPADRAGYGGAYAATSQGALNHDTAFWIPEAGDSTLDSNPSVVSSDSHTWGGDADKYKLYLYPFIRDVMLEPFWDLDCFIGVAPFNEPDIGDLSSNVNMNAHTTTLRVIQAVERVLRTHVMYYDDLRVLEPSRYLTTHGRGGTNYIDSPDWTILWTAGVGGGSATCPDDIKLVHVWHWYPSGQGSLGDGTTAWAAPYDQSMNVPYNFSQDNLDNPAGVQVVTVDSFDTNGDKFKLKFSGTSTVNFVRGTNAAASDLQAALRTVTGDATLTVTGTTDAGPYTVTFTDPNNQTMILAGAATGCTPSISRDLGTIDDALVYYPTYQNLVDTMTAVKAIFDARGIPFIVGEYGIDDAVQNSAQFIIDMQTIYNDLGIHNTIFFLGTSVSKGILIDNGDGTYSLKGTGTELQTQLALDDNFDTGLGSNSLLRRRRRR